MNTEQYKGYNILLNEDEQSYVFRHVTGGMGYLYKGTNIHPDGESLLQKAKNTIEDHIKSIEDGKANIITYEQLIRTIQQQQQVIDMLVLESLERGEA